MARTKKPLPKRRHGISSLTSLAIVAIIGSVALMSPFGKGSVDDHPAAIAVEHTAPLTLRLDQSMRSGQALIELRHNGQETIRLSVPETWERREVWNAPLREITADPPSFGFVRWTLPPDSGISFLAPKGPTSLVLHNPSAVLLTIALTRVNLDTAELLEDIVLVQEKRQVLW